MSDKFEQPLTYIGQIVRWKPHPGSSEGSAALVVGINAHSLSLLVFHPKTIGGIPYDGVLHEKDPRYTPERFEDVGVWAYTNDQDDYIQYVFYGSLTDGKA